VQLADGFPCPSSLRAYEEIHPGFAERIIRLAEEEVAYRRIKERDLARRVDRRALLGLSAATLVTLSGFVLAAFVSQKDPRAAASIVAGELGVIVTGFLGWKRSGKTP